VNKEWGMSENAVLEVRRAVARTQREQAQRLRKGGVTALVMIDTEGLVTLTLESPKSFGDAWKQSLRRLESGAVKDYTAEWQALASYGEEIVAAVREVLELAQHIQGTGVSVRGMAELEDTAREVRAMQREAFKTFPFDAKFAEESLAELKRGEGVELGDAFAQIAGMSKDEWLRRVEEHKARRERAG
jgi:hypothetical protein